ncbi:MAG: hypothetical protein GXP49_03045 [Deltaproteobacteria bacterium]|nr:hypothetical protein [Deltaproteobacteria bacterium]
MENNLFYFRRSMSFGSASFFKLLAVAFAIMAFATFSRPAAAQTVVVGPFSGKIARKVKPKLPVAIAKALEKKGFTIFAYKKYARAARKHHLKGRKALTSRAIKKLAPKLKIDGLIKGAVGRKHKTVIVKVIVLGADGKVLLKKVSKFKGRKVPQDVLKEVVDLVAAQFTAKAAVATGGTAEKVEQEKGKKAGKVEVAAGKPKVKEAKTTGEKTPGQEAKKEGEGEVPASMMPPWAKTKAEKKEEKQKQAPTQAELEEEEEEENWAHEKAEKPSSKGAVPDVMVAVGGGGKLRAGLSPRHNSGLYPGIMVQARMHFATFLDVPVLKDFGIGGSFDMGLGLKYSRSGVSKDWKSTQYGWNAELDYRLHLLDDVLLKPAFLVKAGFGSVVSTIDSNDSSVRSASYMFPYAGLDIYLMLWDPYLRLHLGGSYLFVVMPGEDLSGTGSGFSVDSGLDVVILDMLDIGVGYGMTQFLGVEGVDPKSAAGAKTEMSDVYQMFFLRVGWAFK